MDRETKEKYLQIRITATEKKEIAEQAIKQGHGDTSAFILWLYRKFGKK